MSRPSFSKKPLVWETRPHTDPDQVRRGIDARPDGEDTSLIMSDDIIPGRPCAIGTVSAVTPDDEWFGRGRGQGHLHGDVVQRIEDAPED